MKKKLRKLFPKFIIKKIQDMLDYFLSFITLFMVKFLPKYKWIVIRKWTTDSKVFNSIYLFKEFKLPINILPKFIIDAWAYTWLSTLYYTKKYPEAKIIAIEPEKSNFELLRKHTKYYSNINIINAGLWYKNSDLKIVDKNIDKWSFSVNEVNGKEENYIKAITIDEILNSSGFDFIDILKIDIEWSEIELFWNNYQSWIDKVNVIVIELHDRLRKWCSKSFYSAIDIDKRIEHKEWEKIILVKKKKLY